MPASVASSHAGRPEDLIGRLNSTQVPYEAKLKALRDLKNQIIGNRTKKLVFLKLGAVPSIVAVLASSAAASGSGVDGHEFHDAFLIQSAVTIGSFACGLKAGVKAVLDAGAFPILFNLISHPNEKVVDASARSLKLIYQSKAAPNYDFLQEKNMVFLLSLLDSENENVSGLGASIITHSCQSNVEQHKLSEAGVIKRLVGLLGGSLIQRDASLESLAAVIKDNSEVASRFIAPENGRVLSGVIRLMKDKCPRTRLLSCMCLINTRNASTSSLQDQGIKNKLVLILLELLDDPGQVGDEAPFVMSNLISGKEDMQKLAFDAHVVEKLCENLDKGSFSPKRLEGKFLALADLCSNLECCRGRVLEFKVLASSAEALAHYSSEVRIATCIFLKNVSRSAKNLSAGTFANKEILVPLVQLLGSSSTSELVAALRALTNLVVDFKVDKSVFTQFGVVKQLVRLSKSIEPTIRVDAVWALKNLTFLVNDRFREQIFMELPTSTLTSLISDPEASVQAKALAVVRNLVGCTANSIDYLFREDAVLLHSVVKQLQTSVKAEVLVQGMYILCNVTFGKEHHKEAVMRQLFGKAGNKKESILSKFLKSRNSNVRTAAVWTVTNLTLPSSPGARGRATVFRNEGIVSQLKTMVNDSCVDVKLRTRAALGQLLFQPRHENARNESVEDEEEDGDVIKLERL